MNDLLALSFLAALILTPGMAALVSAVGWRAAAGEAVRLRATVTDAVAGIDNIAKDAVRKDAPPPWGTPARKQWHRDQRNYHAQMVLEAGKAVRTGDGRQGEPRKDLFGAK